MPPNRPATEPPRYLPKTEMGALLAALQKEGYTVIGPVLASGVVSLSEIHKPEDLARGVQDEQDAGHYRVTPGDPDLYFQYTVGQESPKRYLFPALQTMFSLHVDGSRFMVDEGPPAPRKLAFLGVRPCELAAMAIQDRVFGAHDPGTFRCESNPYYSQTKQSALLIVVNCTRPGGTCFCVSMGTGPVAKEGYDIALTEMRAGFLVQTGSLRGGEFVKKLPVREPTPAEVELAELRLEQASSRMKRQMNTEELADILAASVEHPHWDAVAKRCLGCGNCTMVCPTCFCSSMTDSNELAGKSSTRIRRWESCFSHQFTYTTAGPGRSTIRAKYRHRIRHKYCTWYEQFDCNGCVGCGRCITWCPAGIDVTQEVKAIRDEHEAMLPAGDQKGVKR